MSVNHHHEPHARAVKNPTSLRGRRTRQSVLPNVIARQSVKLHSTPTDYFGHTCPPKEGFPRNDGS